MPYPQVAGSPSRRTKNNTPLVERGIIFGADGGGRTRTVLLPLDFELFASYGIQTNSNPYGGRQRTPKNPQLLIILKLMC